MSHPLTSLQCEVHEMFLPGPQSTCPPNPAHTARLSCTVRCPFTPDLSLEGHHNMYDGWQDPPHIILSIYEAAHTWHRYHRHLPWEEGRNKSCFKRCCSGKNLLNIAGSQPSLGIVLASSMWPAHLALGELSAVGGKWFSIFYLYSTFIVHSFS